MTTIKTARGKQINMQTIVSKNETTRAVSNVPVNARGDIIDSRGQVKISREKVSQEYYKNNVPGAEQTVSIKEDSTDKETSTDVVEVGRVARTRQDGSQYFEVEYSDGSMEEINA